MTDLSDLQGKHNLSGWDETVSKQFYEWSSPCDGVCFILDDVKYQIYLDEADGYRSYCSELESDQSVECKNTFIPVEVLCIHKERTDGLCDYGSDLLEIYDINNGKLIATIGTKYTDDYYPCGITEWIPENMSINEKTIDK